MKITNLEKPLIKHTIDHAPYHGVQRDPNTPLINHDLKADFERILSKYPKEQKKSAIIPTLILAQIHNGGHLDESIINEVAQYLEMESIEAFEVATFYSMFNHQPQGKYQLCLCQGVSCLLCGYSEIKKIIQDRLGIQTGEMTSDKIFSFKEVECLGSCGGAPVMMIGDQYIENCTPDKINDTIDKLRLEVK